MSFQLGDTDLTRPVRPQGTFSSVSEAFPTTPSGNWCRNGLAGVIQPAHVKPPVSRVAPLVICPVHTQQHPRPVALLDILGYPDSSAAPGGPSDAYGRALSTTPPSWWSFQVSPTPSHSLMRRDGKGLVQCENFALPCSPSQGWRGLQRCSVHWRSVSFFPCELMQHARDRAFHARCTHGAPRGLHRMGSERGALGAAPRAG